MTLQESAVLRDRLPRTWHPFFARHGNFRPVQLQAIPLILDGKNVVLSAATAGGKTSAALAPLIERHVLPAATGLRIVYVSPTKALAADLIRRISVPLEAMSIRYAVKTADSDTLRRSQPSPIVITTPEAFDSLLASAPKLFITARAVILDELHLLDGTVRGDQLRAVIRRLQAIRQFAYKNGDALDAAVQYVALSATLSTPELTAARYFPQPTVVKIDGARPVQADLLPMQAGQEADTLLLFFETFRARGWKKALVFCNSRAEIEHYAAALRPESPFRDAIYVHYSNLTPDRRKMVEAAFASASAALCFASSTLELGIDIGDVDIVLQIGAPGTYASFTQRIGRGGRRKDETHAALFYRNRFEQLVFQCYLADLPVSANQVPNTFLSSVAIQQIFSLIKQSPDASIRLNPLAELFKGLVSLRELTAIVGELQETGYLREGRPGSYGPGPELNTLIDQQFNPAAPARYRRSLFSNIQPSTSPQVAIVEIGSGQVVANVDVEWLDSPNLILEGQSITFRWMDKHVERLVQKSGQGQAKPFRAKRQLLGYETAQRLKQSLGLARSAAPLVHFEGGAMLFHFLGDVYSAMLAILNGTENWLNSAEHAGLWLEVGPNQQVILDGSEASISQQLRNAYQKWEPLLNMGIYHDLLPVDLRQRAVVERFNIAQFQTACQLEVQPIDGDAALELLSMLG